MSFQENVTQIVIGRPGAQAAAGNFLNLRVPGQSHAPHDGCDGARNYQTHAEYSPCGHGTSTLLEIIEVSEMESRREKRGKKAKKTDEAT